VKRQLAKLDQQRASIFNDAVLRGDSSTTKLLHSGYGADLNGRNSEGFAALHLACKLGHEDIVQWLIQQEKTDLELADNLGYRAIHHCVKRYHCLTKIS